MLIAVAVLAGLVLLGRGGARLVPGLLQRVEALGPWAMIVFAAGYALATVLMVPGSVLTLAAGALFGLLRGTLVAFGGALAGSTAAFLIARHLARPFVERRMASDARIARLDRAVGEEGLRMVLLLRLSPVVPFTVLNYALGITRVRFRDYLLGAVGMLPGTLLYVWSGKLAGDVATAAGGRAGPTRGAAYWAVAGLGLAATLVVAVAAARMARRALREGGVEDDDG